MPLWKILVLTWLLNYYVSSQTRAWLGYSVQGSCEISCIITRAPALLEAKPLALFGLISHTITFYRAVSYETISHKITNHVNVMNPYRILFKRIMSLGAAS
jgi:hypothetical protein